MPKGSTARSANFQTGSGATQLAAGNHSHGSTVTVLDRVTSTTTKNTSSSEETVYTFSVPGGTLGTTGRLRLTIDGDYLNNSGGGSDFTVRGKYGTTTLGVVALSAVAASANRRANRIVVEVQARGATAQIGSVQLNQGDAGSAGSPGSNAGSGGNWVALNANPAENSANALNLVVTIQHSVSNANTEYRLFDAILELL